MKLKVCNLSIILLNNLQKYGLTHSPTDNRMSTERCAHLSCVAIANRLKESWMAKFPFILIVYFTIYYPVFSYK